MWEGLLGEDQTPRRTGIQANDGLRDRYLTLAFDTSGHWTKWSVLSLTILTGHHQCLSPPPPL